MFDEGGDGDKVKVKKGLKESKIKLAEDWATVKKELDATWVQLGDDDAKSVDSNNTPEAQIDKCREKKSRWVFRTTPSIENYYKIGKVLGNPGQYGVVKEAVGTKGKLKGSKVAVKTVFKWKYKKEKVTQSFFEDLRNEVRLMRASKDHPNIIDVFEVFEDIQNLYIIMEHCSGGELFDRISSDGVGSPNFNEAKASQIIRKIISSVYHLHTLGIAHCDLKPENFIFQSKQKDSPIKLIDFGMAKIVHWRMYHRRMNGTPYYIAPEVLNGHYNESCDMWSIGVIMFIIIFGFPPFHDNTNNPNRHKSDQVIYANVKKGFTPKVKPGYGPWFPQDQPVSMSCKDLVARLLRSDVAGRMTSEEAMSHPWITGAKVGKQTLKAPLDADVRKSMKHFQRNCQLQSEILLVLKNCKYLSSHQEDAVKKTFKMMDLDGDGRISVDELYQALHKVDPDLTRDDCATIMISVDANSNGVLEFDELLSSRINRKLISKEERLRKVFKCLDVDGSKTLTPAEIQGALMSIHPNISLEECKKLMNDADSNNDGVIDYEEWLSIFIPENEQSGADKAQSALSGVLSSA